MAEIPIEVIVTHIFPKLPAKSLLICKCVCKSWLTYISTHKFISIHLNNNNHLLILETTTQQQQYSLISLPMNNSSPHLPTKLPLPTSHGGYQTVIGSCHGLLCVMDSGRGLPLSIVNPSTGHYKQIPILPMPRRTRTVNFGFGFDHVHEDYKVVRVIYHYPRRGFSNELYRLVGVYSLKENVWRIVEWVVPYDCVRDGENGALLNTHLLHWIAWCFTANKCRIRCFDICEEKWVVDDVPMPDHIDSNTTDTGDVEENCPEKRDGVVDFGVFDGYLFISSKIKQQQQQLDDVGVGVGVGIDVWIMKEYGCWVRLLRLWDDEEGVVGSLRTGPVAYWNGRKKVLLRRGEYRSSSDRNRNHNRNHNHKLIWYNLEDKSIEDAEFDGVGIGDCFWAHDCIGSLVTIAGAKQFGIAESN